MNIEATNVVDCMATSEWLEKLRVAELEDAEEETVEEEEQTADWVILVEYKTKDCNGKSNGMFGPFMTDFVDIALMNLTARDDVREAAVWNKDELDEYDAIEDDEEDDWDDEEWDAEVQEAIEEAVSQEGEGYVWSDEVEEEQAVETPVDAVEAAPAEDAVPVEETAEANVEAVESVAADETGVAEEASPEKETDTPL